ncbi:MAG: type II toxin-antitoxin system RelE/ParE family toxin [Spirulina sp.]
MNYRVEISSIAEAEADIEFLWISQVTDVQKAKRWYEGLLQAIYSLSKMPKRCSLARENAYFSKGMRQLIYGKGRSCYRILFTIVESNEESIVRILHIRHASQKTLEENE